MPRLFVFGIGGTGARVLKSLTCLLSAGVQADNFDIVPILIDPHKDLPEQVNCRLQMELYAKLHRETYQSVTPPAGSFFGTKMLSLGEASLNKVAQKFDYDERIDDTFGEYISYDALSKGDINRDLIDLLYSEANLNTPLSVGFKGNPNIGSVVLNKFDETSWYDVFENLFSAGDRIFIISSIFGGTGAAGFPLLVKNLRASKNQYLQKAVIGALPVMPYFKLSRSNDPQHRDIDSNSFFTKTKSALSYYAQHLKGVDFLYYLADPHEQSNLYQNDERQQDNKAHLIELIGASGIIDFAKRKKALPEDLYLQYGLGEDSSSIHFKNLGNELRNDIYKELIDFYLFSKLHLVFKTQHEAPFVKNEKFDLDFFRSDIIGDLEKYLGNYFIKWMSELSKNDRKFNPLNMDLTGDQFHKLVNNYEVPEKSGILGRRVAFDSTTFIYKMEEARNRIQNIPDNQKFTRYLLLSAFAIRGVTSEKIKIT